MSSSSQHDTSCVISCQDRVWKDIHYQMDAFEDGFFPPGTTCSFGDDENVSNLTLSFCIHGRCVPFTENKGDLTPEEVKWFVDNFFNKRKGRKSVTSRSNNNNNNIGNNRRYYNNRDKFTHHKFLRIRRSLWETDDLKNRFSPPLVNRTTSRSRDPWYRISWPIIPTPPRPARFERIQEIVYSKNSSSPQGHSVRSSVTLRLQPYVWTMSVSQCSSPCGEEGVQTIKVTCRSGKETVDDSLCDGQPKPSENRIQKCYGHCPSHV